MKRKLRIAGATVNQTPIDWENNTKNILTAISEAKKEQADLVCFPEMSLTGYGCEDLFLADWVSEVAWKELLKIVPYTEGIMCCIGLPIRYKSHTYNGVCVIRNKEILGVTLKQNMARDGVHYEPRWFEAWPAHQIVEVNIQSKNILIGDITYECKGVSIGFEICEDAWRSLRPADNLVNRNIELIINPSASHFAMCKSPSREELIKASSKKYNCVYGYINLLGNEAGRMIYDGDILFAMKGEIIHRNRRLSIKPHAVQTLDIDFDQLDPLSYNPKPDIESKNEEFVQATSLALFDYLRKSKSRGFVLSLSGGADSACCAVIVAEMVKRAGKERSWKEFTQLLNITAKDEQEAIRVLLSCAYQGSKNSSEKTFLAAKELADSLNANFCHWTIDNEVESYTAKIENALQRSLQWESDDITLQNIQARTRSPIIWMLANIKNSILLTTSNRSEADVGYATMDGDTSGSLSPIAGVDKPFILQWLQWAEKELGYSGLKSINSLKPTAELRPIDRDQSDEADLMPYDILVRIEKLAIRDRKSPMEVYNFLIQNFDKQLIKSSVIKFFRLWSRNQWKRERMAPSFHLDDINVDPRSWCRFPILSGGFERELAELERN